MTIDLMHGPQFAKDYVNSYLMSDIPNRMVSYRNGWSLDDIQLPTPIKFLTHEPIALDEWPTLITVAISTTKFDGIDYDRLDPIFRVTYSMRTYVWARADSAKLVTQMRDRLTTIVRSALLDYPSMKASDARESWLARIDATSLREEFSDLTPLKGDRFLAGAYLSYDITIDEIVARESLGTVSEIDLKVKQNKIQQDPLLLDN